MDRNKKKCNLFLSKYCIFQSIFSEQGKKSLKMKQETHKKVT